MQLKLESVCVCGRYSMTVRGARRGASRGAGGRPVTCVECGIWTLFFSQLFEKDTHYYDDPWTLRLFWRLGCGPVQYPNHCRLKLILNVILILL